MRQIFVTLILCFSISAAHAVGGPFGNKNKLGDIMMVMSPAYALGITIMVKDAVGTMELAGSVLAAQLASETIKMLEIETRPNGRDKKSFPSGHPTGAFSGAMFVHKRYGWRPALIPYGIMAVAGWSRVAACAHYWHDVATGAVISALFTWIVVDKYLPDGVSVSADTESVKLGFDVKF